MTAFIIFPREVIFAHASVGWFVCLFVVTTTGPLYFSADPDPGADPRNFSNGSLTL